MYADILPDVLHELSRQKRLAEAALAQLNDDEFFRPPAAHVNSIAVIVKHLAGNLTSRWTDFLTTDGEKPDRDRDGEFQLTERDTRSHLVQAWEAGWDTMFRTLGALKSSDLERSITIRGERHSVLQAALRGLSHSSYHVGQILYLVRLLRPDSEWLTAPPGKSNEIRGEYRPPAQNGG
jgi:uncharacterized damage-inducible protein DinB